MQMDTAGRTMPSATASRQSEKLGKKLELAKEFCVKSEPIIIRAPSTYRNQERQVPNEAPDASAYFMPSLQGRRTVQIVFSAVQCVRSVRRWANSCESCRRTVFHRCLPKHPAVVFIETGVLVPMTFQDMSHQSLLSTPDLAPYYHGPSTTITCHLAR